MGRNEIDLVNSKNQVEKSKEELQRLMGFGLGMMDEVEFMTMPLEKIKINDDGIGGALKMEDHLQSKTTDIQKKIHELKVDLVRRQKLPEWFLSTGMNYSSADYLGDGKSFLIVINWDGTHC